MLNSAKGHIGSWKKEMVEGIDPSEYESPLWRADWGIKQWVPYLLSKISACLSIIPGCGLPWLF
jgi:hypothetical protein